MVEWDTENTFYYAAIITNIFILGVYFLGITIESDIPQIRSSSL